jgi:hypothetical protein
VCKQHTFFLAFDWMTEESSSSSSWLAAEEASLDFAVPAAAARACSFLKKIEGLIS